MSGAAGAGQGVTPATLKANGRFFVPAVFLLLSAAPGGLRSAAAWCLFSAALIIYLAFMEKETPFSGLGAWGLLGVWLLAAALFSPEPLNSFWWFFKYLALLAFWCLARGCGEASRAAWIGAVFLLAGASCLAFFWQTLTGRALTGLIGPNVNYSSTFIAAAFAGVTVLLLGAKTNRVRLSCAAGLLLLGAAMAAINSRGAVLGAVTAVYSVFLVRKNFRTALYFAIAALLVIVLLPAEKFNWLLKLYDPRSLGRFDIWGSALDAIAARPLRLGTRAVQPGVRNVQVPFLRRPLLVRARHPSRAQRGP